MKSFRTPQETVSVLQEIFTIVQHLSGMDYLRAFIKNIAKALEIKYIIIGHATGSENKSVQTDVVWAKDRYLDNFTYELSGTPCENVLSGNRVCVYPNKVASQFPDDLLLEKMSVKSYLGAPILDRKGNLRSIFILLHDEKIENQNFYAEIIEFLAMRVGTELDRIYSETLLKKQVKEQTEELKQLSEKYKNFSITDQLTGLCNRRKLDSVMEYQLAQLKRYGGKLSLILMDIDKFKHVNDTYGHQAGDNVLAKVSQVLSRNSRETDTLGRWGGEEFLFICPNINNDQALHLAEKYRKLIAETPFPGTGNITASFGVGSYNKGDTKDSLLKQTDDGLYKAKASGRNKVIAI